MSERVMGRIGGGWGAFTVLEVLVVVAIVGLLMAMLLPALQRARAQGRLVQCGASMREVGVGLNVYADENGDLFPLNDGEGWESAWACTQGSEIIAGYAFTWTDALQSALGRDGAPWLAPLRCPESVFCPAGAESVLDVRTRPGSGWILNSYCRGRQRSSISASADGVLVMENACWGWLAEDTGCLAQPKRPECYPHPSVAGEPVSERWEWAYRGQRRNILWCDGHVATFGAGKWPDSDGAFDRGRIRHMRFNRPGRHPLDP